MIRGMFYKQFMQIRFSGEWGISEVLRLNGRAAQNIGVGGCHSSLIKHPPTVRDI